eukprot:2562172-Pleurochrysis_carterae.AAC.2
MLPGLRLSFFGNVPVPGRICTHLDVHHTATFSDVRWSMVGLKLVGWPPGPAAKYPCCRRVADRPGTGLRHWQSEWPVLRAVTVTFMRSCVLQSITHLIAQNLVWFFAFTRWRAAKLMAQW